MSPSSLTPWHLKSNSPWVIRSNSTACFIRTTCACLTQTSCNSVAVAPENALHRLSAPSAKKKLWKFFKKLAKLAWIAIFATTVIASAKKISKIYLAAPLRYCTNRQLSGIIACLSPLRTERVRQEQMTGPQT